MTVATADHLLADAIGTPCPEPVLAAFEAELGTRLPPAYRGFLRHRNGGVLRANLVVVRGWMFAHTDVYALFGLARHLETCDLRWNREVLRGVTGEDLLPVACDAGGSPFCLDLSGGPCGRVIYIPLEQPSMRHVVAAGFGEFLAAIRPLPAPVAEAAVPMPAAMSTPPPPRHGMTLDLCIA